LARRRNGNRFGALEDAVAQRGKEVSSIVKMGGDGSMQDLTKINENLVQRTAHLANELNNAFAVRRKLEVSVFSTI
jgi:hypothetical protein